jgi:hypothetical protein
VVDQVTVTGGPADPRAGWHRDGRVDLDGRERLELAPADALDMQGLPDDVLDALPGAAVFSLWGERGRVKREAMPPAGSPPVQGGSRCGDGRVPSPSFSNSASRSASHTL